MRHAIRRSLMAALCCTPVVATAAATTSLSSWYEQLPQPPKTAAEAQARVRFDSGQAVLDYPALSTYVSRLQAHSQQLQQSGETNVAALEAASTDMYADLSKAAGGDLNDPEFLDKLESMSDAEKMALAQRMANPTQAAMTRETNGVSIAGAEPAPVTAALNRYRNDLPALNAQSQSISALVEVEQVRADAHARLDASLDQDAKTCASQTDAQAHTDCLKQKALACWDRHASISDEQLAALQKTWQSQYTSGRKLATGADQALAPAQYGQSAKSMTGKTQLLAYQSQLLLPAEQLAKASEAAWLDAGKWRLGKAQSDGGAVSALSGSCAFVAVYGRSGTNGRSGTSRSKLAPVNDAAKKAQDGAKKVLDWLKK